MIVHQYIILISRNYDPYLGVTGHYISKDWELKRLLMACMPVPGSHTSEFLAAALDNIIDKVHFPETTMKMCTTDNQAAIVKAVNKTSDVIHSGVQCLNHSLQLIIKDAINHEDLVNLKLAIDSFKKLSAVTHKSPQSQELIRAECLKLNLRPTGEKIQFKKIITHTETRWNSMLMMVRSIMNLRRPLNEIWNDKRTDKNAPKLVQAIPKDLHFTMLANVIPILEEFEDMTTYFETEKVPTISWVIPRVQILKETLITFKEDFLKEGAATTARFVQLLMDGLDARFPDSGFKIALYAWGNILHPYFRGQSLGEHRAFMTEQFIVIHQIEIDLQKKKELASATEEEKGGSASTQDSSTMNDEPEPTKRNKKAERAAKIANFVNQQKNQATAKPVEGRSSQPPVAALPATLFRQTLLQGEIAKWSHQNMETDCNLDILLWWKTHELEYPLLSNLAKRYLCVQPTSCSCERTFSTSGNTITNKRTRLSPNQVKMLVYVKENYHKIQNLEYKEDNRTKKMQFEIEDEEEKKVETKEEENEADSDADDEASDIESEDDID